MFRRALQLLHSFLFAVLPGVGSAAGTNSDAELLFELAARRGLDVTTPLEWSFQISAVPGDRTAELVQSLKAASFADISLPDVDDDGEGGPREVWCSEVRLHSVESLSERMAVIQQLIKHTGGVLELPTVAAPAADP
jgi:hypothetical protein